MSNHTLLLQTNMNLDPNKLKTMTRREIMAEYWPKVLSREMTSDELALALSQAKVEETTQEPSEPLLEPVLSPTNETESDTTHTDEIKGKSQKARILSMLQDHLWHTSVEIMHRVYNIKEDRGVCRIPARICELRKAGYEIDTDGKTSRTVCRYRLV